MRLNKGQEEAVRHGEGPCMVLAPPGSGKTLIITERTKYLIEERQVKPERILVITFTRYAAREMRERFAQLTEGKAYPVTFGTFHSVFYGILKCVYGLSPANLLSEKEGLDLLRHVVNSEDITSAPDGGDEEELLRELAREISIVKNGLLHLHEFQSAILNSEEFAAVFRAYEHKKKEQRKFDFDDMMVQCYALFKKRPDILSKWQDRFTYILIDEFQDINRIQYEIMRLLTFPENNLFVVGDDDQSIYGFRGAKPELMLYMKQEFPEIRTIPLTVNYRSTEFIVGAGSRVIYHNEARYFKRVQSLRGKGEAVHVQEVKDEAEEGRYIAVEIEKLLEKGTKPEEIAVLYRTAMQARMVTEILNEHHIAYETKERVPNFYEHFIARDMLAYLKLASGDRARNLFLQIANRPVRYLSRASMEHPVVTFEELRCFYCDKEYMQDIIDQLEVDLRILENMAPYAAIQYIRKRVGYDSFLKEYAKEHQIPWHSLMAVMEELEERCKTYRTFEDWRRHIKEYTKELEAQRSVRAVEEEHQGKVQLMTMHAAKGLEFESVFVIHANEGEIPYQKAETKEELEEERRMFYVALTRAKERLYISYITEKNGNCLKPSRFVAELLGKAS
ncbi:ATP-dependent helicase [Bariatricus massiliensis]|uniref:DNA 3'-5' helicase n=1 Tax=Bariatricus massiliensis TaxID=1745713 RepID=A0ABS8DCT5_9FIRM|nr:ATP-dependent helicase [Bariatricus massiliensis]MCB7303398.1 ATP-dependent helicase [Bariatricus massiliensis]MCB7373530.1 ATP-dependent helicase [Bariatricus massiliensis]MCB7386200.1 ATP-dependent helicase [Bariatricus massiliensis]MCB7410362.1 ATP-dependent helicase [Bariatricus massiliensis]MCQ5252354.1 ATP-dependent helicase [Bariatricus massiliensis]